MKSNIVSFRILLSHKVKQLIKLQILLILILLIVQSFCSVPALCSQDCTTDCQYNSDKQYICKCSDGNLLNNSTNICTYTKCDLNLFYQQYDEKSLQKPECLLKCGDKYEGNIQTNVCDQLNECSTYTASKGLVQLEKALKEVYKITDDTMLAIFKGYITQIKFDTGVIYKTTTLGDNVTLLKVIQSKIFILTSDNIVSLWDIQLDAKLQIFKSKPEQSVLNPNIILVGKEVVCLSFTNSSSNQQLFFQPLYNLKQQSTFESPLMFNYQYQNNKLLQLDDLIFIQTNNQIIVTQIMINQNDSKNIIKSSNKQIVVQNNFSGIFQVQQFLNLNNNDEYIIIIGDKSINFNYISISQNVSKISNQLNNIFEITKLRIIQDKNQNITLYIQLAAPGLIIYNSNLEYSQIINKTDYNSNFTDIEITQIDSSTQELFVLTDKFELIIFQINSQKIIQKVQSLQIIAKQIQAFYAIQSYYGQISIQGRIGVFLQTSNSLQYLWRDNQTKLMKNIVLANFQYSTEGLISDYSHIVLIESYSILATCTITAGILQLYDLSSGYKAEIFKLVPLNDTVTFFKNVYSKYLIASLLSKILLIDFITGNTYKQINFSFLNGLPIISVNGKYTLINYDGCFELFDNNQFTSVFKKIDQDITTLNIKIELSSDLRVIIQKSNKLLQVKININSQTFDNLQTVSFQSKINYFNPVKVDEGALSDAQFFIDEVIIYEEKQIIHILKFDFSVHYQLEVPKIKTPNEIKRVVNDSNVYFMVESSVNLIELKAQYQLTSIIKDSNKQELTFQDRISNPLYGPFISDPKKITLADGSYHYLTQELFLFDSFQMFSSMLTPVEKISKNQNTFIQGYLFVSFAQGYSSHIFSKDNRDGRNMVYFRTKNGLIGGMDAIERRYEIIDFKSKLTSNDDQIIKITQNSFMGKYFVQLKNSLQVYSIFDDTLIKSIQFENQSLNSTYHSLQDLDAVIYSDTKSFFIYYFSSKLQVNQYSFKLFATINSWFYLKEQNKILLYGSGFVSLDMNLNVKKTIVPIGQYLIEKCILLDDLCFCKLSISSLIKIDLKKEEYSVFQINGFSTTSFLMEIDFDNKTILLVDTFIQVYSFEGNFKTKVPLSANPVIRFVIVDIYIILQLKSSFMVLSRNNYSLIVSFISPGGINIVKFSYFKQYTSILFFCQNSYYAQIFIYSIKQLALVGRITQQHPGNGTGAVVDYDFEEEVAQIIYLDDQGNFIMNFFYNAYDMSGTTLVYDIQKTQAKPLGFSIDFISHHTLIYTKDTVYKLNYVLEHDKIYLSLEDKTSQYTKISEQSEQQQSQFLVIGKDNFIFKYLDYQLTPEINFQQTVQCIRYISQIKTLVIAFQDHLNIYAQYQYGDKSSFNQVKVTEEYLFNRFIDDNVFLTNDQKLIHFDFLTNKALKIIKLNATILYTLIKSSLNTIIIGYGNGDIQIYYKQTYDLITKSEIKNLQSDAIKKAIRFVEEIDEETLFISSSQGEIMKFNVIQKTVEILSINKDVLKLPGKTMNLINQFIVDKQTNRLYIMYYSSKTAYVWSITDQKLIGYMIAPNNQSNRIQFTKSYVLVLAVSYINIYQREGDVLLINNIRGNYFIEQITQVVELNKYFIAICYQTMIQVHQLKNGKNILVQKQMVDLPSILEYTQFDNNTGIFRILLISSTGIIELRLSTDNYLKSQSNICAYSINSLLPNILEQQVKMIQPKQIQVYNDQGRTIIPQNDQQVNFYIKTKSEAIQYLNSVLQTLKSSYKYNLVFSPISEDYNYFLLENTRFSSIQQIEWNLVNYKLKFSDSCKVLNNCKNIGFDSTTKKINWQNITLDSQLNLNQVTINFVDLTQVVIKDFTIFSNRNDNKNTRRNLADLENPLDCFLYFKNIEKVFLYNIKIDNNQLTNNGFQFMILQNVKYVFIQNFTITNNKNVNTFISFNLIDQLILKDIIIDSNTQQSNINNFIFQSKACSQTELNNLKFEYNQGYNLIYSSNIYKQQQQIITLTEDIIKLNNHTIVSNKGDKKSLVIIQNSIAYIEKVQFLQNYGNCQFLNSKSVQISSSNFILNNGTNGGAMAFYGISQRILLQNVNITKNNAQGSGGGIYTEDIITQDFQIVQKSLIKENIALIGGGLRILNKLIKSQLPKDYPYSEIIIDNKSTIFGDNSCTVLSKFYIENGNKISDLHNQEQQLSQYSFEYISLKKSESIYDGLINIDSFKSGGDFKLNIFVVDDQMKKIVISSNIKYTSDVQDEIDYFNIQAETSNNKDLQLIGETILNSKKYNEDLYCFQIQDLSISSQPGEQKKQFTLQIKLNPYSKDEILNCMPGEILVGQASTITICQYCKKDTYSLITPPTKIDYSDDNNNCKPKVDGILDCAGNQILLRDGYWRSSNISDEIIQCDPDLRSCVPQQQGSSLEGCKQGYIGPLCEECDIKGDIWSQNQTVRFVSSFQDKTCRRCTNILFQYLFFIIQTILMLGYFISNSKKFIENFVYTQSCYYLRKMNFFPVSKNTPASQSASYIKIVLAYLQFSSLLMTSPQFLPVSVNIVSNTLGSSNKAITLSVACIFSKQTYDQLGKSLVYGLANLLTPIIFMIICLIFIKIIRFKNLYIKKYIYLTLLFVVYMFFLVDVISFFTTMLTCRKIGSHFYHKMDLLSYCSDSHVKGLIFPISASILAFWSLSPLIVLYFLRKNNKFLELCSNKFKYGYIYYEMKTEYYYWEFMRLYIKIGVIIIYTLLKDDNILLSRILIVFIFVQYIRQVSIKKPFSSLDFTKGEILTFQVLTVKLILLSLIEGIHQISLLLEILQYFLEYIFLIYLFANVGKLMLQNTESLAAKLILLIIKRIFTPHFYQIVTKNISKIQFTTYLRWKKVRTNIKNIIHFKANQQVSVQMSYTNQKVQAFNQEQQQMEETVFCSQLISMAPSPREFQNLLSKYTRKKQNSIQSGYQTPQQSIFKSDQITLSQNNSEKNE